MLDMRLKEHTRREHAMLEKKLLHRISMISKVSDYVALLSLLYGYYAAVEDRLTEHVSASKADFVARRKAARILDDMAVHATDYQVPTPCARLPNVNSFHSALGVLYVLEGSTLGGRIIAQLISRKLAIDSGLSFFLSYGDDVELMWISFKDILRGPFSPEQEQDVLAGALETFETFNYWLTEHE